MVGSGAVLADRRSDALRRQRRQPLAFQEDHAAGVFEDGGMSEATKASPPPRPMTIPPLPSRGYNRPLARAEKDESTRPRFPSALHAVSAPPAAGIHQLCDHPCPSGGEGDALILLPGGGVVFDNPVVTTATRRFNPRWGCAFCSVTPPCVAQRVCPMAM